MRPRAAMAARNLSVIRIWCSPSFVRSRGFDMLLGRPREGAPAHVARALAFPDLRTCHNVHQTVVLFVASEFINQRRVDSRHGCIDRPGPGPGFGVGPSVLVPGGFWSTPCKTLDK